MSRACVTGIVVAAVSSAIFAMGQTQQPPMAAALISEPHHLLKFENENVRAYLLELAPGEATESHRHAMFYAVAALTPVKLANEVRGRAPVPSEIPLGEISTSKGGFVVAERNVGNAKLSAMVLEFPRFQNDPVARFEVTVDSYRLHHAATVLQLEGSNVRMYAASLAAGGYIEPREQKYDQLLVPIGDIQLSFESPARGIETLQLKRGDVVLLKKRPSQSFLNTGNKPADFFVIEFR